MKTFVTDEKGAKRYEILARWVGLERLTALQDALLKVEGKIGKAKWNQPTELKRAQESAVAVLTKKTVNTWDVPSLIKWLNNELTTNAGASVKTIAKLEELERVAEEVLKAHSDEESRAAIGRYESVLHGIDRLSTSSSPLAMAIDISSQRVAAHASVERLRHESSGAQLHAVWSAARDYLAGVSDDACPVCARPFDNVVSLHSVLTELDRSLAALKSLSEAEERLGQATASLQNRVVALDASLAALMQSVEAVRDAELTQVADTIARVRTSLSDPADPVRFDSVLRAAIDTLRVHAAVARQHCVSVVDRMRVEATAPWPELLATVRQLIAIRDQWVGADREERELLAVQEQFKVVADAIRTEVRSHVKQIIEQLESDVCAIYSGLRDNDQHVPVVGIDVAADKKSMNVTISLFGIDGVPPSGYLSDSQLNSLGLALYLAAVRRFNSSFKFVVLDDIMSSYDASHRLNLVQVIQQYLTGHQVILTTHDEVFFDEIKAALGSAGDWHFLRLKPWTLEPGVRFEGDISPDDDIERRLRDGDKPEVIAQLIMDSVERSLCAACYASKTHVKLPIKKDGSPAMPTMKDLWAAAQSQFGAGEKAHPSYVIVNSHKILNLPRHAATNQSLKISLGELQTFWANFKTFRDAFLT